MEKPFYKKFKFLVAVGAILLEVLIATVGEKLPPELMQYVLALAIALISGHTITDSVAAIGSKKK